ncbi:MAG: carbohydrate kinase [Flavobacteriaceae bacterium]|nr:carbohydrate kinase [Flavobacteriaceae bacterium]
MPANQVICFGEILWDIFPQKQMIGGAPLNVALRLHSYDTSVAIISRIGDDTLGRNIKTYLTENEVSQGFIQTDKELPTGTVNIIFDDKGDALYDIQKPVAWDVIEISPKLLEAVKEASFFIFGSLTIRGGYNRETLRQLLPVANTKIFDVNLRSPHYHISMVYELMQQSDFIKLNYDELLEICDALGCQESTIKDQIKWLIKITNTDTVCVTKGDAGAILFYEGEFYEHDGYKVKVIDTVGAGDSFLATLIYCLFLKKDTPQNAIKKACAVGALVASKEGANCLVSEEELLSLIT